MFCVAPHTGGVSRGAAVGQRAHGMGAGTGHTAGAFPAFRRGRPGIFCTPPGPSSSDPNPPPAASEPRFLLPHFPPHTAAGPPASRPISFPISLCLWGGSRFCGGGGGGHAGGPIPACRDYLGGVGGCSVEVPVWTSHTGERRPGGPVGGRTGGGGGPGSARLSLRLFLCAQIAACARLRLRGGEERQRARACSAHTVGDRKSVSACACAGARTPKRVLAQLCACRGRCLYLRALAHVRACKAVFQLASVLAQDRAPTSVQCTERTHTQVHFCTGVHVHRSVHARVCNPNPSAHPGGYSYEWLLAHPTASRA